MKRTEVPMLEVTATYEGSLRCRASHSPSKSFIVTDAPLDNHGKGESFSPTDLVAAALPTCIMTIMGIVAKRHDICLEGMCARTQKEMSVDGPRRIASLRTYITMPIAKSHPHRETLEQAAHTCPVHRSLHPDIHAPIEFLYAKA